VWARASRSAPAGALHRSRQSGCALSSANIRVISRSQRQSPTISAGIDHVCVAFLVPLGAPARLHRRAFGTSPVMTGADLQGAPAVLARSEPACDSVPFQPPQGLSVMFVSFPLFSLTSTE
jgi:hypothetical protein